jgi:hypothetical protein
MGLPPRVQIQKHVHIIDGLAMDPEAIRYVSVFYESQFLVEGLGCVVAGKYAQRNPGQRGLVRCPFDGDFHHPPSVALAARFGHETNAEEGTMLFGLEFSGAQ